MRMRTRDRTTDSIETRTKEVGSLSDMNDTTLLADRHGGCVKAGCDYLVGLREGKGLFKARVGGR